MTPYLPTLPRRVSAVVATFYLFSIIEIDGLQTRAWRRQFARSSPPTYFPILGTRQRPSLVRLHLTTNSQDDNGNNNPLSSFFQSIQGGNDKDAQQREARKRDLLQLVLKEKNIRKSLILDCIQSLQQYSPTADAATSPLLRKTWNLVWTTEKEINVFLDYGLSNNITQTISDGGRLQNNIAFVSNRGHFGVDGTLSTRTNQPLRTYFEFETATLQLKPFPPLKLPPIGKGWFDTVYLDDHFRVDVNSRDDILICTADPNGD